MPSTKSYLTYILDRLSSLDNITTRAMMGEYIIYCDGKVVGGIYDDRFLVKRTKAAETLMPDASLEIPYPGAKPMLLVDNPDDSEFLCRLLPAIAEELPKPKGRKK